MDGNRFDELAMALAESGTSRRSILTRAIGGGFAAALAAIGITAFEPDEAEAKKSCKKKCKKKNTAKKRRKCKKRCKKKGQQQQAAGYDIDIDLTLLGSACTSDTDCNTAGGSGLQCTGIVGSQICTPLSLGLICTTGAECSTGSCVAGLCAQCDAINICGAAGNEQCCVADATCVAGLCVLPKL